jgi:hypothetical protein
MKRAWKSVSETCKNFAASRIGESNHSLACFPRAGHTLAMITEFPAVPLVPDFIGQVETRLRRELAAAVEDWGLCVTALTHWEDDHLLDGPSVEMLARHKQNVERLLQFGQFLVLATEQPDFPDRSLASVVMATQQCLRDKLVLWHGPTLSEERRAEILKACFNEP